MELLLTHRILGTYKFCGVEPLVIARMGQPASSLWFCVGGGFREGTTPLPGFWMFAGYLP